MQKNPPLIVKHNGKNKLVVAFSDLDGTVNNQELPEAQRLSSTEPAITAFQTLECMGIAVGVITGRSLGESIMYKQHLNISGLNICEDGSVIIGNGFSYPQNEQIKNSPVKTFYYQNYATMILGGVTLLELRKFTDFIKREFAKLPKNEQQPFINSLSSSVEEIQQTFGHSALTQANDSKWRLASFYYSNNLSSKQQTIIQDNLAQFGLRSFGNPPHILSSNTNKGIALQFINEFANPIYSKRGEYSQEVQGILPIVFGNDKNDIELFNIAEQLGGIGVLVSRPDDTNSYYINTADIPSSTIKADSPYGLGISKSIPQIQQFISQFTLK